jgi:hypothetical protein
MKWIKVKSSADRNDYELWNDDHRSLTLTLFPSGFTQIDCDDLRRKFIIEKKGLLRARNILRNEYGIKMGQVVFEKAHNHEGTIEIEDHHLQYAIFNRPVKELVIYKNSKDEPLLVCGIMDNTEQSFGNQKNLPDAEHAALLLVLSWFLFTPVSKESMPEYAV